jgi:hypothetical protein
VTARCGGGVSHVEAVQVTTIKGLNELPHFSGLPPVGSGPFFASPRHSAYAAFYGHSNFWEAFMRVIPAILAAIVGLGVWTVHAAHGRQNKRVQIETIHPDFIAPPENLNETFLQTPFVIRGRVIGNDPKDKAHAENRGVWIRTAYRVEVLEIFRAPVGLSLPREVTVIQSGGDRDRGSHIERLEVGGFPQLHSGSEYVMFLARADSDAWGSAYGPDGVFERVGTKVVPLGNSKLSLSQKGKDWEIFVRAVRNHGIQ